MAQTDEIGKLFVGGLSWQTTQASLLAYFTRFGEVTDCVIITNPTTGKSRGFGFVTFKDPASVELVQAGGPHMLDGKQIDPNGCNRKKTPKGSKSSQEGSKRKLFVGGLPSNIDEAQLKEGFSNYGKIQEVVIVYDQQKQKPRGFGFVTFESEESVEKIVKERFVLLNGKQVECKRAEAREPSTNHTQEQGVIVLPDGTMGLISPQTYPQQPASLLTPVELASAYRGAYSSDIGHIMQPGNQLIGAGGVKYMAQAAGGGYVLVQGAPGAAYVGGGGAGYMLQGAGTSGGVILNNNSLSGLVVNPAGGAYQLLSSPGAGGCLVQAPHPTGNIILPGSSSSSSSGLILQQHQPQTQYVMQCGAGAAFLQPSLDAYATQQSSAHHPSYHLSDLQGSVIEGVDKTNPALFAQSYQVINPYASTTILNGGATEGSNEEGRPASKQKEANSTSSSSPSSTTPSIPSMPKVGYRILPFQSTAQYAAFPGSAHSTLVDAQTALITSPYTRLASAAHKFHPYRR